MELNNDKIIIYKTEDGQMSIDGKLGNDTVWLNRLQKVELFGRAVVAKFATTEFEARVKSMLLNSLIAESRTEEKDVMVKVTVNLINKNNYEYE